MRKEKFYIQWYYLPLKIAFIGSYVFFALALILLGIFESDVEIAGFFWSGVLAIVYWLIYKVFCYFVFD